MTEQHSYDFKEDSSVTLIGHAPRLMSHKEVTKILVDLSMSGTDYKSTVSWHGGGEELVHIHVTIESPYPDILNREVVIAREYMEACDLIDIEVQQKAERWTRNTNSTGTTRMTSGQNYPRAIVWIFADNSSSIDLYAKNGNDLYATLSTRNTDEAHLKEVAELMLSAIQKEVNGG